MILRGLDLSRNLLKNDGDKRCKNRLMIGALFLKCCMNVAEICMFSLRILKPPFPPKFFSFSEMALEFRMISEILKCNSEIMLLTNAVLLKLVI